MDLLRLVVARQSLDKLLQLPRLANSKVFLEARFAVMGSFSELSSFSTAYMSPEEIMKKACFLRNPLAFNYFASAFPNKVDFWAALATNVPEIQARALSLIRPKDATDIHFYGISPELEVDDMIDYKIAGTRNSAAEIRQVIGPIERKEVVEFLFPEERKGSSSNNIGLAIRYTGGRFVMERDSYLEALLEGEINLSNLPRIAITMGYIWPFFNDPRFNRFNQFYLYRLAVDYACEPLLRRFGFSYNFAGTKIEIRSKRSPVLKKIVDILNGDPETYLRPEIIQLYIATLHAFTVEEKFYFPVTDRGLAGAINPGNKWRRTILDALVLSIPIGYSEYWNRLTRKLERQDFELIFTRAYFGEPPPYEILISEKVMEDFEKKFGTVLSLYVQSRLRDKARFFQSRYEKILAIIENSHAILGLKSGELP